jgi:tetratricopeptide (TPR) repeat protein
LNESIRLNSSTGYVAFFERAGVREQLEDADGAMKDYTEAIRLNPNCAQAYACRGVFRQVHGDSLGAVDDTNMAVKLRPDSDVCHSRRGLVRMRNSDFAGAIEDFSIAIRLDPKCVDYYLQRGFVREIVRQREKALEDFNECLKLDSKHRQAYMHRGAIHCFLGNWKQSLKDFDSVLDLDPKDPMAYAMKANVLAACPDARIRDGKKALELAKKACELGNYGSFGLQALAEAYAENGQFDEAVRWQKKALDELMIAKKRTVIESSKWILKLYESKRPPRLNAEDINKYLPGFRGLNLPRQ